MCMKKPFESQSLYEVGLVRDIADLGDVVPVEQLQNELISAKNFSEKIMNSFRDKLMVVDPATYRVVRVNDLFVAGSAFKNAREISGKTCHEVLFGRGIPCHEAGVFCPVRRSCETGKPHLCKTVHPVLMENGKVKQIETYPISDQRGGVDLVLRIERDVTETKKLEHALAKRSEELCRSRCQLKELLELSREIGTKSTMCELARFLLDHIVKILPGSKPAFLLLDASCEHFLRFEDFESEGVEGPGGILRTLDSGGLGARLVGQINRCKAGDVIGPTQRCEEFSALKSLAGTSPLWSALPLFVHRKCIGLLFLGSKAANRFPSEDFKLVNALCEQASGHLRNLVKYEAEVGILKSQVADRPGYGDIIGRGKGMQEIYELIDLVACSDATVLIGGENGTGKELVACAIHKRSPRHKGPFVVANCSAYSPTLLESEIFGHEKGAFTGATHQKKGRIERANGGTLFLDEIGEIAPAVQILLLRFLQDHCFERVGGERVIAADVRVLAATNRDLLQEVRSGRFRDDLFYRLNVISINLPRLRERCEDIPLLAHHFLAKHNLKEHKNIRDFSSEAMRALLDYDWPGNVRQLENAVSHAVVLSRGELIRREHLPRFLRELCQNRNLTSLSENERGLILKTLQKSNWNKHDAALRLKISRSTLYSKIRRYGLMEESAAGSPARS